MLNVYKYGRLEEIEKLDLEAWCRDFRGEYLKPVYRPRAQVTCGLKRWHFELSGRVYCRGPFLIVTYERKFISTSTFLDTLAYTTLHVVIKQYYALCV
ncbi:hypothetical protein WN55_04163 [Dufourea novaeangliae]|uniref:Uncharacterized protein n=1 Tax=Dufourea novaeangliae TaxID=178035 RepID=A0A154PKD9_DUFNO|nr:hypothetical protein WN55_04163 [Dufourea novaeangliae]